MASNQTPVFGLNQWSLDDGIIMAEFNADNQKTEQALVEANAAIAALQQESAILRADRTSLEQAIAAAKAEAKAGDSTLQAAINAAKSEAKAGDNTLLQALNAAKATIPKIATGTYVGTGTCGVSNPTSLTFDFEPKLVIITVDIQGTQGGTVHGNDSITPVIIPYGASSFTFWYSHSSYVQYDTYACAVAWDGTTIRWWNKQSVTNTNAYMQLNKTDATYRYFAIG